MLLRTPPGWGGSVGLRRRDVVSYPLKPRSLEPGGVAPGKQENNFQVLITKFLVGLVAGVLVINFYFFFKSISVHLRA
jgi:hypothetical protein